MRAGVRLGKILGIPIFLDYSFFLALIFVTWLLANNVFPDEVQPDPATAVAWGMALVGAIVFFTSLLMHELAHSVAARMFGLHVANITLFVLGGVSQIKEESRSATQEFVIAFVGPLTSALLGLGFIGLYYAVGSARDVVPQLLLWLGFMNVVIAIFNMIPRFPPRRRPRLPIRPLGHHRLLRPLHPLGRPRGAGLRRPLRPLWRRQRAGPEHRPGLHRLRWPDVRPHRLLSLQRRQPGPALPGAAAAARHGPRPRRHVHRTPHRRRRRPRPLGRPLARPPRPPASPTSSPALAPSSASPPVPVSSSSTPPATRPPPWPR